MNANQVTMGDLPIIRILLADDHQMFREGLRNLLDRQDGFEVLADCPDGRAAVQCVATHKPDVLVIDVTMPGLNGIEATRQLKAAFPNLRVIGLSMHGDREFVTQMLGVGASGYLLKDCPFQELVSAIRAVVNGEVYLSSKVAGLVVRDAGDEPKGYFGQLTPREREVLQMVADGASSKEIAYQLKLSVKTVDTHRRQVMEKLRIYSVAGLTHYAIRQGVTALH